MRIFHDIPRLVGGASLYLTYGNPEEGQNSHYIPHQEGIIPITPLVRRDVM